MNDLLFVYLHFDQKDMEQLHSVNALIPRIDEMLLEQRWEYTGVQNMYRPIQGTDPDATFFAAEQALKEAEWLKEYKPYVGIGVWTNACDLDEIVAQERGTPDERKLKRYREYYEKEKKFAHGIIVDEDYNLRDGYMTYLLARERKSHPDIMMVRSGQIFRKIVSGKCDGKWTTWYYDKGPAVCPGDEISVPGGTRMKVERIGYVAGKRDCEIYEPILTGGDGE